MGKGRKPGSMNKTTKLAKEAIAEAFEKLGGTEALVAWALADEDNRKVFYTSMYTKLIPVQTEITGKDGDAIKFEEQVRQDAHAVRSRLTSGLAAIGIGAASSGTVQ